MASDNLRKRILKKKKQQSNSSDSKPPLPETKNFLTVPSINTENDDNTSDGGYASNTSAYSDMTDTYANSNYTSDSEQESHTTNTSHSTSLQNSDEAINNDNTQSPNAKNLSVPSQRIRHHKRHHSRGPKSIFAFRRVYFILGIIIGACTIYLATKKMDEYKEMPLLFKNLLNDIGMSEYFSTDFVQNMSKIVGENFSEDDNFLPGRDLAKTYNLTAKYPIFIIPGITSCGLETWMDPNAKSSKCSETYFRKRMWGTLNMPKAILLDRKCWLEHMMLDPETGLDPPGYKLRASPGKNKKKKIK